MVQRSMSRVNVPFKLRHKGVDGTQAVDEDNFSIVLLNCMVGLAKLSFSFSFESNAAFWCSLKHEPN